jgi:hypothetical protein
LVGGALDARAERRVITPGAAGLLYGQAHLLNTIAATATTGYLAQPRGAAAGGDP